MDKTIDEQNEYYLNLGKFISAFGQIDDHLFKICQHALGVDQQRAAIVFYRSDNLSARLSLTDPLVQNALSNDAVEIGEWKSIVSTIRDLSSIRNKGAHNPLMLRITLKVSADNSIEYPTETLLDARPSSLQQATKGKKVIVETAETIGRALSDTVALLQRLDAFSQRLAVRFPARSTGFQVHLQRKD